MVSFDIILIYSLTIKNKKLYSIVLFVNLIHAWKPLAYCKNVSNLKYKDVKIRYLRRVRLI